MEKTLEQLQQENTYLKQENEILKDILRKSEYSKVAEPSNPTK